MKLTIDLEEQFTGDEHYSELVSDIIKEVVAFEVKRFIRAHVKEALKAEGDRLKQAAIAHAIRLSEELEKGLEG